MAKTKTLWKEIKQIHSAPFPIIIEKRNNSYRYGITYGKESLISVYDKPEDAATFAILKAWELQAGN